VKHAAIKHGQGRAPLARSNKQKARQPERDTAPESDADRKLPLRPEARHGLVGEVVNAIEPESEADPAALTIQFLVTFGFLAGRNAYYQIEGDKHYPNLSAAVVGDTSRARKGTSWGRILSVFVGVKPWPRDRVLDGGLSTGEGLITQAGSNATDKRLLIVEGEFSRTLRAMSRSGNTLSQVLRGLWDRGEANILTRGAPVSVDGAHTSIIGHITEPELESHLSEVEMFNGFANRFLWVAAQRSKELPFGGDLPEATLKPLRKRIQKAVVFATKPQRITWAREARDKWANVYCQLAVPKGDAQFDAVTGRAEAQVCRLALIYALLDKSKEIRIEHLDAALAVWDYCNASARKFFAGRMGNGTAEDIRALLLRAGNNGVRRTAISKHFSGHRSTEDIDRALKLLESGGFARREAIKTKGRSAETWVALPTPRRA
jgi:Protein of unknown function (DUF3987)